MLSTLSTKKKALVDSELLDFICVIVKCPPNAPANISKKFVVIFSLYYSGQWTRPQASRKRQPPHQAAG